MIDTDIMDILVKENCVQHYRGFDGLTKVGLSRLPLKDLTAKLKSLLSGESDDAMERVRNQILPQVQFDENLEQEEQVRVKIENEQETEEFEVVAPNSTSPENYIDIEPNQVKIEEEEVEVIELLSDSDDDSDVEFLGHQFKKNVSNQDGSNIFTLDDGNEEPSSSTQVQQEEEEKMEDTKFWSYGEWEKEGKNPRRKSSTKFTTKKSEIVMNFKTGTLTIHPSVHLNKDKLKEKIALVASKLKGLRLDYYDECVLHQFLDVLDASKEEHLKHLISFVVLYRKTKQEKAECVSLIGQDWLRFANIRAPVLQELIIGFGMWDDVDLEQVFKSFPNLRKLVIAGCFTTILKQEPNITIEFPALQYLQYLSIGESYKFSSPQETLERRPDKRKAKNQQRIRNEDEEPASSTEVISRNNYVEDQVGEFFSITLKMEKLPELRILILGALFEIDNDTHFSYYPKLEVFRVSSPWHLKVCWPTKDKTRYPKLKEIQLPDSLTDCLFVENIPKYFPNVEKCVINLPSIRVLRTFGKVMKNAALKHLELRVQYDFSSSLDIAFAKDPTAVEISKDETRYIRCLKKYKYFEDYINEYKIDIPTTIVSDLSSEVGSQEEGLWNFENKLESFRIWYISRTLRIPQGDRHWMKEYDDCEFSTVLLGFKEGQYPMTTECWNVLDTCVGDCRGFDMSRIQNYKKFKYYDRSSTYNVDASASGTVKQEFSSTNVQ